MRTLSTDTGIKAEAPWIAMLRKAKHCQKFAQVRSLSETVLSLSRRAIGRKHSDLEGIELEGLFIRYQYGDELGQRFERYLKSRSHEEP